MSIVTKSFQPVFRSSFILFLIWFVLSILPFAVCASSNIDSSANEVRGDATIFIYHHFDDDRYPTTNVSLKNFTEQMAYLADNNYTVMPLTELVDLLLNKKPLPQKVAVITIDDGYKTIYSNAWPVLKKYGFPFTVFLYVEGIERGYKNYLTWEQVKEMQAAGIDFQTRHVSDKAEVCRRSLKIYTRSTFSDDNLSMTKSRAC